MMNPVIALDIDGVLSPMLKDSDHVDKPYRWRQALETWPNDPITGDSMWMKTDCMDAYVAKPVADFLREVANSGRADIMWHSTWGNSAKNFEEALDLPDLPVLFGKYSYDVEPSSKWNTLIDVEGLLYTEGRRVIWVDDQLTSDRVPNSVRENANLFCVTPGPGDEIGLNARNLELIDWQLEVWTP